MGHRDKYETVIGLEVHVQLSTKTKAFCGCSTSFGDPPNTHVCPVCLGMPGVLPVFNREFLVCAVKVSLALGCDIQEKMKFDRKNYYYPDLPKNYQISQFDMPLAFSGKIRIMPPGGDVKDIGITRVHLEEDAGKLMHAPEDSCSYVDLNRTGTPLLEIVSEPDMRSPEEAYEYLVTLKRIVKYLDVSDCNMEEGSLRCDANISIREKGDPGFGSKVEIKNMNSFKAVREALSHEQDRQMDLVDEGEKIPMETRLWDEKKCITASMRSKEESHDYRYFPEPDLVPFEVEKELVEKIRAGLPELPRAKKFRFEKEYGLEDGKIENIIAEKDVADFYEETVKKVKNPQICFNWIKGEVMMHMNERGKAINELHLDPGDLAEIIIMSGKGVISNLVAKDVLRECIDTGESPDSIVKKKGLEQVSDEGALDGVIREVIDNNRKSVDDFKNGKENALSFLVGQVMRLTGGKANPKLAGELLRKNLQGRE